MVIKIYSRLKSIIFARNNHSEKNEIRFVSPEKFGTSPRFTPLRSQQEIIINVEDSATPVYRNPYKAEQ